MAGGGGSSSTTSAEDREEIILDVVLELTERMELDLNREAVAALLDLLLNQGISSEALAAIVQELRS
jgi:hypothetical protein